MSFGSLSGPAIEALNRGSQIAGCLQSTGEGGVSSHHLKGGDLIWQVGTAYFGCRDADGRFSMAGHSALRSADEMLDFVEWIAGETGLPVGIKSAVGDSVFWISRSV